VVASNRSGDEAGKAEVPVVGKKYSILGIHEIYSGRSVIMSTIPLLAVKVTISVYGLCY